MCIYADIVREWGWLGVNLLLLMHHLTRNSFNFKLNYTHDGAYAYLHRVIIELTPPSIILLTPMLHSKLNWIPKNLHNSPSKITTHFGSHSNHSIPHHIQKPSPHTTPEIPKKHPQFRAAEIQKCILRGCSDDERDVRRYREACIPEWVFFPSSHIAPSPVMMFRFFHLSRPPPPKLFTPPTLLVSTSRHSHSYRRTRHPASLLLLLPPFENAFCVWNYSYYC